MRTKWWNYFGIICQFDKHLLTVLMPLETLQDALNAFLMPLEDYIYWFELTWRDGADWLILETFILFNSLHRVCEKLSVFGIFLLRILDFIEFNLCRPFKLQYLVSPHLNSSFEKIFGWDPISRSSYNQP